eukprot:c27002_g1_i1.p2 GENE.c27002_g1_i1~~c27002_g1_i1.p2  ORF type:complete len:130 (+),score=18.39 c27002_g1_i1:103-492(+)
MFKMPKLMKSSNKRQPPSHPPTSQARIPPDHKAPLRPQTRPRTHPKTEALAIAFIPDSPFFRPRMNGLTKADRATMSNTWEIHIAPNRVMGHKVVWGVTRLTTPSGPNTSPAIRNQLQQLARAEWDDDD